MEAIGGSSCGWGRGNCGSRVEHFTRDKSRDNRKKTKGEGREAAKDRFQVDGHPNGSLQVL